jgi:hemolysin activation/secretion protein
MRRNRFLQLKSPSEWLAVVFLSQFAFVLFCPSLEAQEGLHFHPAPRSDQQPLPPIEEKGPQAPLIPIEPHNPPSPQPGIEPGLRVFVREIDVTGVSVFSEEEISEVTQPYTHRVLTSEDLQSLRRDLTVLYIRKGYINSGATLPDQTIIDGKVTVQIVEGLLSSISIEGHKWLRDSYYSSRLARGAGPPLNVNALEQRLQILQQGDIVQQVRAELRPGLQPGESELNVKVVESPPLAAIVGFNNYQSYAVGAEQGFVSLALKSLLGYGDILSFSFAASEGARPLIDAGYSLPFTPLDTSLILHYMKNDYKVVKASFEPLNIRTKSEVYGVGLRQPLYRSVHHEFSVSLTGEHLQYESSLLGEPFSFSPGEQNGESTITALRASLEWLYRSRIQVLAARSRFSLGIDALDATLNPDPLPDSQFFVWLGQFQWASILGSSGIQSIFKTDIQLASDPLLSLEQIPVGGRYSVRGYRENLFVRDNAVIASVEVRVPLIRNMRWADYLQLAPFFDYGRAWNTTQPTPADKDIYSVGIGIRWGMTWRLRSLRLRPEFEIYWGHALKDINTFGNNLQDDGIHLQFTLSVF